MFLKKITEGSLKVERIHGSDKIIVNGCLNKKENVSITVPDSKRFIKYKINEFSEVNKFVFLDRPSVVKGADILANDYYSPLRMKLYKISGS